MNAASSAASPPLKSVSRRRSYDLFVKIVAASVAAIGIFALFWILFEVFKRGAASIDWAFFTQLPTPAGVAGGGLANALVGNLLITGLAVVIGVPIGLFAGVYFNEFGQNRKLGSAARFAANALMGTPSIIVGLFVYALMVMQAKHFSGYAGAVALAIIMLPVVARTTEDMLGMVPNALRESALALGAPRWKVTTGIVFRAAKSGLITGVLLAAARVTGETAPLLFTALNSPYWPKSLNEPTANLTVTIFNYAMSPYDDWQSLAWGASLIIMAGTLLITVTARVLFREKKR